MRWAVFVLSLLLCMQASAQTISPTTGHPLQGELTAPVLVSIGNHEGEDRIAGMGRAQPWGAQHADIIYESLLARHGSTRMTYLFHDALVNGCRVETGPVRSVRSSHAALAGEWRGVLLYSSGTAGNRHAAPNLMDLDTPFFSVVHDGRVKGFASRLGPQGARRVKAPNNLSVDVSGVSKSIGGSFEGRGLSFGELQNHPGMSAAASIHMNWGYPSYQCHYIYEGTQSLYLRFNGGKPAMTWHSGCAEEQSQLAFSNVIVQFTEYEWIDENPNLPDAKLEKTGKIMIFTQGQVIPGRWVWDGTTYYVDGEGREILLAPGKTLIAHFPVENAEITWETK